MKITNNAVSQTSVTAAARQATGPGPVQNDAPADGVAPESDSYAPSAEWSRLLQLVGQEPEVREDRIQDVTKRLQTDYYFKPESAAGTADAILVALD